MISVIFKIIENDDTDLLATFGKLDERDLLGLSTVFNMAFSSHSVGIQKYLMQYIKYRFSFEEILECTLLNDQDILFQCLPISHKVEDLEDYEVNAPKIHQLVKDRLVLN